MRRPSSLQQGSLLVGLVFLALGIVGFIPVATSHYGDLSFAGADSHAQLLYVFQTSILHNLVFLVFGVAGTAASASLQAARSYLLGGGVLIFALFVYGLAFHGSGGANWLPNDNADNLLHLGLSVAMLGLGVTFGSRRGATI